MKSATLVKRTIKKPRRSQSLVGSIRRMTFLPTVNQSKRQPQEIAAWRGDWDKWEDWDDWSDSHGK